MPRNVAQWTGLAVTAIIVFGRDADVIFALPFGMMAGVLATLLVTLDDYRRERIQAIVADYRQPAEREKYGKAAEEARSLDSGIPTKIFWAKDIVGRTDWIDEAGKL